MEQASFTVNCTHLDAHRHFSEMKIRKCHGYTLQEKCPTCGETAPIARPPRFSPEDRYGKYRRRLKRDAAETATTKSSSAFKEGSR